MWDQVQASLVADCQLAKCHHADDPARCSSRPHEMLERCGSQYLGSQSICDSTNTSKEVCMRTMVNSVAQDMTF